MEGDRRTATLDAWGLKIEAEGLRVVGAAGQVSSAEEAARRKRLVFLNFLCDTLFPRCLAL